MPERLEFVKLKSGDIDVLPRNRTLFTMVLSPLEVHGPHLPMGTDVMVAEEIRRRCSESLLSSGKIDYLVDLPPFHLGSDTIPSSVEVDYRAVYHLLLGTGNFLSGRGFRYLLVLDNHGGPRHQIATARAARKLRGKGVCLIAPFLDFYRKMVERDEYLSAKLGAVEGEMGDVQDCHAGHNETGLMLRTAPDLVGDEWKVLPEKRIDPKSLPHLVLGAAGRVLSALGLKEAGKDLDYIGMMLSWVTSRNPSSYIGCPATASPDAGERMLQAFAEEAVRQTIDALEGKCPEYKPLGWSLRFLAPVF
ncbi:MAG: creatininase family protein [Candidatus Geothermincolales bacterium]